MSPSSYEAAAASDTEPRYHLESDIHAPGIASSIPEAPGCRIPDLEQASYYMALQVFSLQGNLLYTKSHCTWMMHDPPDCVLHPPEIHTVLYHMLSEKKTVSDSPSDQIHNYNLQ